MLEKICIYDPVTGDKICYTNHAARSRKKVHYMLWRTARGSRKVHVLRTGTLRARASCTDKLGIVVAMVKQQGWDRFGRITHQHYRAGRWLSVGVRRRKRRRRS